MWVRGLKPSRYISTLSEQEVASYVGAWIETDPLVCEMCALNVASYVGAWIETFWAMPKGSGGLGRILCGCVD